ncbi:hypothetical protein AVEN_158849-1 [Araneus ventricosus]|uniref:Uncharacterized protein n=1 Tax=Araneus ventricosus TaxID=182803 RepID=A0A4Y2E564_ARAVE|nr:hypothetical protein AVEN_158849-1 [Araneus ventricosus]
MMKHWQSDYGEGDKGLSTLYVFPKVSLQSANWKRADVLFLTGNGPLPSYLQRFHRANFTLCRWRNWSSHSLCDILSANNVLAHETTRVQIRTGMILDSFFKSSISQQNSRDYQSHS